MRQRTYVRCSCCSVTPSPQSTIRYLGIELEDALVIAEKMDVYAWPCCSPVNAHQGELKRAVLVVPVTRDRALSTERTQPRAVWMHGRNQTVTVPLVMLTQVRRLDRQPSPKGPRKGERNGKGAFNGRALSQKAAAERWEQSQRARPRDRSSP